jgi:transmembrane sensor
MSVHGPNDSAARVGLAAHVVHEVPPARLERQWSAISSRHARRRLQWRWAAYAGALALAFVLGVVIRPSTSATDAPSWDGALMESVAGGSLRLPDGAEAQVGPGTRLRVGAWDAARATFALETGQVTLDVPKLAGRTWVVAAGAYDVRVVGTRFSVRLEPGARERLHVEVMRGRVQVHQRGAPGEGRALSAGESWSGDASGEEVAAASASAAAPSAVASADAVTSAAPAASADPSAAGSGAVSASPSSAGAAPTAAPSAEVASAPSWEEHAKARRYKQAYETLGPDGYARAIDSGNAEKLFRLADVARGSGHPREAERAYDTIRKRYRSDARAGLAAFELGRLRLDALKNPGGAAEALSDAIALAPGAPFREDAEARRVQALHASGATAACVKARDAYLARYPSGAHAAVVRLRCGSR